MKNKYDASLNAFLKDDEECFGVPPICQNETIIDEILTYRHFVKTGTQKLVEDNLKLTAKRLLSNVIPNYIPQNFKIEVISRLSNDIINKGGFVVSRAYIAWNKDNE